MAEVVRNGTYIGLRRDNCKLHVKKSDADLANTK